jgi:hypothetical protein
MDVPKAFMFVGDDPRWVTKVLVGGLVVLLTLVAIVTVVGWLAGVAILYGYFVRLTRNVAAGEARPLPEWEDWGGLLADGARAILARVLFVLPVIGLGLLLTLPATGLAATRDAAVSAVGGALLVLVGLAVAAAALLWTVAWPLTLGRYATTGDVGVALRWGETLALLRAHPGPYLLVLVLAIATRFVGNLGFLALGVGMPFTVFYAQLVNFHLYGQALRQTRGAGAAAAPPEPLPLPS